MCRERHMAESHRADTTRSYQEKHARQMQLLTKTHEYNVSTIKMPEQLEPHVNNAGVPQQFGVVTSEYLWQLVRCHVHPCFDCGAADWLAPGYV